MQMYYIFEIYHTTIGRATINTKAYSPNTHTLFSFSTIHDGKAIPKLIAPGPSGLPYFSQFLLDSSSVKAYRIKLACTAVQLAKSVSVYLISFG